MSRRSKRHTKCKSLVCDWAVAEGDTHCSSCKKGLAPVDPLAHLTRCKRFKGRVEAFVKRITVSDAQVAEWLEDNPSLLTFLVRVVKHERENEHPLPKIMFRAKQLLAILPKENYSCSVGGRLDKVTCMLPTDQLLARVVDWWELTQKNGFNGTIHCYWGYEDFCCMGPTLHGFWHNRDKLFNRRNQLVYCATPHRGGDVSPETFAECQRLQLEFKKL